MVRLSVNVNDECEKVLGEFEAKGGSVAQLLGAIVPLMVEMRNASRIALVDRDGSVQELPQFRDWWRQ